MPKTVAHVLDKRHRTGDVEISENVDFEGLFLSKTILEGLKSSGFVRPSPIQLKAIPIGRCGLDLIVQAKSGTGKTCVFTVIALESVIPANKRVQALVLAPTHEIAFQNAHVVQSIGSSIAKLRSYAFTGGIPITQDKLKLKCCHVATGTPGRIKQLIEEGTMVTDNIRLLVLDEADKLLEEGFQDTINWIYSQLPENKQIIAASATYTEDLAQFLMSYMRNPTFVRLNSNDPALLGVKQYFKVTPFYASVQKKVEEKDAELFKLLNKISFNQCIIFSNYQARAQVLCDKLKNQGWPTMYISGSQDQQQRMHVMSTLQKFQCRILISTDLISRGIDAEHVNLVINLDVPWDKETYLHRIGRAGRFGTVGIAVTFLTKGNEEKRLMEIKSKNGLQLNPLPDRIDNTIWQLDSSESTYTLEDVSKSTSLTVIASTDQSIQTVISQSHVDEHVNESESKEDEVKLPLVFVEKRTSVKNCEHDKEINIVNEKSESGVSNCLEQCLKRICIFDFKPSIDVVPEDWKEYQDHWDNFKKELEALDSEDDKHEFCVKTKLEIVEIPLMKKDLETGNETLQPTIVVNDETESETSEDDSSEFTESEKSESSEISEENEEIGSTFENSPEINQWTDYWKSFSDWASQMHRGPTTDSTTIPQSFSFPAPPFSPLMIPMISMWPQVQCLGAASVFPCDY